MLHEAVDSSHCTTPPTPPTPPTPTPLTPRSTKKAFMETMLAPEPSALDEIYDEERAIEMFVPGYTEVAIMVGESPYCTISTDLMCAHVHVRVH